MRLRLESVAAGLRGERRKAVVPFFTAGYPDERTFLRLLEQAAEAGCRIAEIGVPFSDPIADGPAIQASSQQALANGMTLRRALELADETSSRTGLTTVLMSYVNPLLRIGIERFADQAGRAGVAGVVVPDLPPEESAEIRAALLGRDVALVDLVAPTSSAPRIAGILERARGFLYLVAVTGVTGSSSANARQIDELAARVEARGELAAYVGFGVADADSAWQATRSADGVIIGSALVRKIREAASPERAVTEVRHFLDGVMLRLEAGAGSVER